MLKDAAIALFVRVYCKQDGVVYSKIFEYLVKMSNICFQIRLSRVESYLVHFGSVFYFYNPWKRRKTMGFLTFSRGIDREYWAKMG